MNSKGSRFAFPLKKSPQLSMEKIKADIFDGPHLGELMKDPMFDETLKQAEPSAWQSLKSVITNYRVNYWSAEYDEEIEELLKSFFQFGHECHSNCTFCAPTDYF